MPIRPLTPPALADVLAERVDDLAGGAARPWTRVAFDGSPTARPGELADSVAAVLRARGRPALRVDVHDFLRPASIRLEHGRNDPDSFYESWFDLPALTREVLHPLGPSGTGMVLPRYWNAHADRSARASYIELALGGVLVLSGPFLLGSGLELELTIHCAQSPSALERRMPIELEWTLPAYARYAQEMDPERLADVVVRMNDPARPALVL